MDVQAVINLRPEVVIIDELAHTNIEEAKCDKRWQDVGGDTGYRDQCHQRREYPAKYGESLNEEIREITGVEVKERVPDGVRGTGR